jgi:very-short-patch-repair endonuclease
MWHSHGMRRTSTRCSPATTHDRREGTLIGRVDWLLDQRLVLECDSERWHGSWQRRKADLRRDRRLAALGYCVLRFSWEDLIPHRDQVIAYVRGAIRAASA